MLKNYFLVFSIFLFFTAPATVLAVNHLDIAINEIAWMGTNQVEGIESKNLWRYEWLELYNNTTNPISLDSWKIELYRTDLDYTISLKGEIPANGYFLVVASDKIVNYDFNYSNLGGEFNNDGQKVVLKDNLENVVDELDCFSYGKWFAGDNLTKQTMERVNNSQPGNDPKNWQASQNPGGTPEAKNSLIQKETDLLQDSKPEIISYPPDVFINEILPSPLGADEKEEWIELFNQNNFEVDLSDWKIEDIIGAITTYNFPKGTKISSQGFLILLRPLTKIALNNDNDGLKLIQPDGNVLDIIDYEKAPRGQSYSRTQEGWKWTTSLTPGTPNKTIVPAKEGPAAGEKPSDRSAEKIDDKKELATISQALPGLSSPVFVFLVALLTTFLSAIVVFFFKKRFNKIRG